MKKKKFGELLIDKGFIDQKKLDEALARQSGSKRKLGEIMVLLGYLSEEQLTKMLGDLSGVPAVDLKKFTIDKEVSKYVSADFCSKHRVIPIAIRNYNKRDHLVVAFADPMNLTVIDELHFIVNLPLFRVTATSSSIKEAILRTYPTAKPQATVPGEIPISTQQTQKGLPSVKERNAEKTQFSSTEHDTDSHHLNLKILCIRKSVETLVALLQSKKVLSAKETASIRELFNI